MTLIISPDSYHATWAPFITKVLQQLSLSEGLIEFNFVDIPTIKTLHERHLNDPTETDIMAFDLSTPEDTHIDIYICEDVAKKNALTLKHSLTHELQTLIIHGLLHCTGYDDTTPEKKAIMFAKQDAILKRLK